MPASPPISVDVTFTITFDPTTTRLSEIERDLRRDSRRVLARALTAALGRVEDRLVETLAPCARCGGRMRSRGRTLRRLITLFGALPVRRARYACVTCRAIRQPLDEWIGPERYGVYSRSVCEQALYLAAELSFERAAEVLRHVGGIAMSGRQIERVLKAESPRIAATFGVETARIGGIATVTPDAVGLLDCGPVASSGASPVLLPDELGVQAEAPDAQGGGADLTSLIPLSRFRRGGGGASSVARLRQLKAAGRWNAYWSTSVADDSADGVGGTESPPKPSGD